ncbi:hypothetical protein PR048_000662 [Dryococelus australis]|uniref:Uncharacterized protein n=1 Tax=Dryococelus australis TaxID=614101 RepID=A0ABQ9IFE4_9NEOP|nr:hypothetical protein PR048_000662 [Dryococelus australis]
MGKWLCFSDRRKCRRSAGFLRDYPFPLSLHPGFAPLSSHFTHFGSQDLVSADLSEAAGSQSWKFSCVVLPELPPCRTPTPCEHALFAQGVLSSPCKYTSRSNKNNNIQYVDVELPTRTSIIQIYTRTNKPKKQHTCTTQHLHKQHYTDTNTTPTHTTDNSRKRQLPSVPLSPEGMAGLARKHVASSILQGVGKHWPLSGAAANEQTSEARVYTGLWSLPYRSLKSRNFPIPTLVIINVYLLSSATVAIIFTRPVNETNSKYVADQAAFILTTYSTGSRFRVHLLKNCAAHDISLVRAGRGRPDWLLRVAKEFLLAGLPAGKQVARAMNGVQRCAMLGCGIAIFLSCAVEVDGHARVPFKSSAKWLDGIPRYKSTFWEELRLVVWRIAGLQNDVGRLQEGYKFAQLQFSNCRISLEPAHSLAARRCGNTGNSPELGLSGTRGEGVAEKGVPRRERRQRERVREGGRMDGICMPSESGAWVVHAALPGDRSLLAKTARPPTSRTWFHPGKATPGFSEVEIVPDDAAGWRYSSGISRFPRPCVPILLHSHLIPRSSTLKTSHAVKSLPNLSTQTILAGTYACTMAIAGLSGAMTTIVAMGHIERRRVLLEGHSQPGKAKRA